MRKLFRKEYSEDREPQCPCPAEIEKMVKVTHTLHGRQLGGGEGLPPKFKNKLFYSILLITLFLHLRHARVANIIHTALPKGRPGLRPCYKLETSLGVYWFIVSVTIVPLNSLDYRLLSFSN